MKIGLRGALRKAGAYVLEKTIGPGGWVQYGAAIPKDWPHDWWQRDYRGGNADFRSFAPVAACQGIISQDLSRIPLRHMRYFPDGSSEPVLNKAPMRVFRRPNSYQVKADWIRYIMLSLLIDGNAYNYAIRNNRQEIEEYYPLRPDLCYPYLTPEGEVFYRVATDPTTTLAGLESGIWIPARDMLHIRGSTPIHPLIGESPLVAAVAPTITGSQINNHNASFFTNMGRPSGILRHPGRLSEEAMQRVKGRFKSLSTGQNTGEVLVLSEGMEWSALTMTAVDAAVADMYRLSERQIFQIYRVPPFLAGDLEKANISNVPELIRFYLQSGLAVWENLLEEWFTRFFGLPPDERIEFDVEKALLQGDLKTRMEAYTRGVQGGVLSIDDARKREGLPPDSSGLGGEVRVQQQMVPLSYGAELQPPNSTSSEPESALSEEEQAALSENVIQLRYAALKRRIG